MYGIGQHKSQRRGQHCTDTGYKDAPAKGSRKSLSSRHIRVVLKADASSSFKGFSQKQYNGNQKKYQENNDYHCVNLFELPLFSLYHRFLCPHAFMLCS